MEKNRKKAQVIVFAINKGGTGKTTSVACTGAALARRGYKVLMLDLDPQQNLAMYFNIEISPDYLSDAIMEEKPYSGMRCKSVADNLWLQGLGTETEMDIMLADKYEHPEYRLRDMLQPVLYDWDFILIDTSPAITLFTQSIFTAADGLIIPITPSYLGFRGMTALVDVTDKARELKINKGLKLYSVLFTQFNERIIIHRKIRQAIDYYLEELDAFTAVIRTNIDLVEAPAEATDIFHYNIKSNGAKDYDAFALRLLQHLGYPELTDLHWLSYAPFE